MFWKKMVVGAVLRTRTAVKPLYVSVGHRCTLAEGLEVVMGCVRRFRLPEPLRRADWLSRRLRRAWLALGG